MRGRGIFITLQVADSNQKSLNLPLERGKRRLGVGVLPGLCSRRNFGDIKKKLHPVGNPCRRGGWRTVIRSALHQPTGQSGREDTRDLCIIYLWRGIKNVALVPMTFSRRRTLIAHCYKDPPPAPASFRSSHYKTSPGADEVHNDCKMPCRRSEIKCLGKKGDFPFLLFVLETHKR